ncbi:MAG: hypothetical protein RBR67_16770 [Desulfobacterium sp.]|jgi:hypothetical protein|nr:hypothetical protein [Desulfobacterium sp.]MDY0375977.1 hypothetical protein [Desulfobacterium sp.]
MDTNKHESVKRARLTAFFVQKKDMGILSDDDELRDGGTALTAYARMQFEEMSDYEREEIRKALLKYYELDTMAMVRIYEGWKDLLQSGPGGTNVGG